MFFARTIRRKLLVTLVLVLGMLGALAFSGVTGLQSYRHLVVEFDRILNKTPDRAHLAAGIAEMFAPLRLPVSPARPRQFAASSEAQQTAFLAAHDAARQQVVQLRQRMEDLSSTELDINQRAVINALLEKIDEGMAELGGLQDSLRVPGQHAAAVDRMLRVVADLTVLAQNVPDPAAALDKTLELARRESKSKLIVIYTATVVAFLLLAGAIRFGWLSIFKPITRLHQGALRVAHGDLDFRLDASTRDEMAELAEAFNEMTSRFQEIRGDLDRQVHERSQQLVRSERLANVGFLSAGVAHEINNPLAAISMAAESSADRISPVLDKLDPAEAAVIRQYLQMIQDEAVRCRQITERLLDFARGRDHVREPIDLTRLVQEVIGMMQHLGKYRGKNIAFEPHGKCVVEANGAEIKQVVLNLVANGLEAMDRGGTLRIHLTEQTDHVRLQFDDEGCGMTPDVLDRIFEPFFTQKQVGQGTGLGLSISHRIVNQHGGSIDVRSAGPGQGSTFSIRLPRRAVQRGAA